MASVSTNFKRLFVRSILWASQESGESFLDTLRTASKARLEGSLKGKVLIATSGNGHASTFQIPPDFTPSDAADLVSEILDRYDEARAKLVADGQSSPTDQQICDEIMDKLLAIRSSGNDFRGLRYFREEIVT